MKMPLKQSRCHGLSTLAQHFPCVQLLQHCQTLTVWVEIFHTGYLPQAEFFLESFR